MTTPTQGEHAQTEALDDLYLKLHGMSKRLESSGRIDESDAPEAYPAILDAMNLVRRLQCESAQVAALTPTPECLTCNDHGAVGNILTAEPCPDCTPAQPAAPQGVAEVNWWEADGDKYDASISPMQPAQGVAYAELPEPTPDELRAIARKARDSSSSASDDCGSAAYVLYGWRAAIRASNGQAPAGATPLEEIQWRNIKKVVRALADHCFGDKNDPRWGVAHISIVNSLTAKDGIDILALGLERLTPTAQAAPAAERQYINGVKTVADLVNNLLLLDQSLPIYAAQHIQIANRRRTITVPPTVSLERVKDERWIGEGDELNAAVIWTRADAPAAGAVAGPVAAGMVPVAEVVECGTMGQQTLREIDGRWRWLSIGEHLYAQADTGFIAAPTPAAQADSQPAPQGETNVQLDIYSNHSAPGQQRGVAGSVALGQPMGHGPDQVAGHPGAQGDKLLTVAERNIRSFLRSAVFKSESDREAALSCVDVLCDAVRAQADSVTKERLKELLGKPETVHLNMLHGHIAVITMEQCAHLHGEEMQRKWAAADSVLEDAARLLESQYTWITNVAAANLVRGLAARKQGVKP